jgi:hypothetical protein
MMGRKALGIRVTNRIANRGGENLRYPLSSCHLVVLGCLPPNDLQLASGAAQRGGERQGSPEAYGEVLERAVDSALT